MKSILNLYQDNFVAIVKKFKWHATLPLLLTRIPLGFATATDPSLAGANCMNLNGTDFVKHAGSFC
jgi:hypothetical protein